MHPAPSARRQRKQPLVQHPHRMVRPAPAVHAPSASVFCEAMAWAVSGVLPPWPPRLPHDLADPCGLELYRCHRLSKTCLPSEPVRRRRAIPRKRSAPHTAQLEQKLNDLLALVRSSQQDNPTNHHSAIPEETPASEDAQGHLSITTAGSPSASPVTGSGSGSGAERFQSLMTPISTPASHTGGSHVVEPQPHEAEECLHRFRTQMLQYFPFMHLPPALTAQELRTERPHLWLAIMSVSWRVHPQQMALSEEFRAVIAQKLVVEQDRSIDLLLGLLTYIAWYQSPQVPRYGSENTRLRVHHV